MPVPPSGAGAAYIMPAVVIPLLASITGVPDRFDVAEEAANAASGSRSRGPEGVGAVRTSGLGLMAVLRGDGAAAYTPLRSPPEVPCTAQRSFLPTGCWGFWP